MPTLTRTRFDAMAEDVLRRMDAAVEGVARSEELRPDQISYYQTRILASALKAAYLQGSQEPPQLRERSRGKALRSVKTLS